MFSAPVARAVQPGNDVETVTGAGQPRSQHLDRGNGQGCRQAAETLWAFGTR